MFFVVFSLFVQNNSFFLVHVRNLQVVGEGGVIKVDWMLPSEIIQTPFSGNKEPEKQDEKVKNNDKQGENGVTQNISYYYVRIRKRMMGGNGNGDNRGSAISSNRNERLPSLMHTHRNQKVPANQTHVEFSGKSERRFRTFVGSPLFIQINGFEFSNIVPTNKKDHN